MRAHRNRTTRAHATQYSHANQTQEHGLSNRIHLLSPLLAFVTELSHAVDNLRRNCYSPESTCSSPAASPSGSLAKSVAASSDTAARLRFSWPAWIFIGVALAVAVVPFSDAISRLFDIWNLRPEYSHGILIPLISALLIWRQRAWLAATPFKGSWAGLAIIAVGLALWFVGELATLYTIVQYSFLIVVYGLALALLGWPVFRRLWMPLFVLIFMVPLPPFLGNSLSLQMQLVSSSIGVALIRLAGISVFLEGNVIDLGVYQLQVAEACDGLRYMFPLMTMAFIVAYFFRAPFWKRAILFLSSVPIAILMNSLRIGVIGITVEYWGPKMAEGMLHDFEGWVVFMLSTFVLVLVAMGLTKLGTPNRSWRDALAIDMGPPLSSAATSQPRSIPKSFYAATALAASATVLSFALPERSEPVIPRAQFADFPAHLGEWSGRRESIDAVYLNALHLDDYVMTNYTRRGGDRSVNLYVSYYNSQRKGQSTHSPRSCIPGGGWNITSFGPRALPKSGPRGETLNVNRAVVELGSQHQIVYYWFQQRGRVMTNEYQVKWLIFWDALTRNRTDGAMVRLTAASRSGVSDAELDRELTEFAAAVAPTLAKYIPD